MSKLLSIIIANRNDTTMLSVTVNSCIEELRPLGLKNCEIVICDNSDLDVYKQLNSYLPIGWIRDDLLRIHRQDFPCLFTARETAIKNARGKYICCLDSHILVGRDMFVGLVKFMEDRKDNKALGFAHAPVNWSHHHERGAVHDRDMSASELGNWNKRYDTTRKITWKGMPWICQRNWFLDKETGLGGYGALSAHKLSWGGGDMHIGIKPWLLGFENWAVPCNSAIHIGPFPKVDTGKNKNVVTVSRDKYRLWSISGEGPHAIGFLISCYILGGESMMERNAKTITERFGCFIDVRKWWDKAIEFGKDEKAWLDDRKVITFEQLLDEKPWKH